MSQSQSNDTGSPPFHLVNSDTGKHIGPFSTVVDALLARSIGAIGWDNAELMDRDRFMKHRKGK